MCFIIDYNKHPEVKIAKKDIRCYKNLIKDKESKLISPYYNFEYELGKRESTEMRKQNIIIQAGFHTYSCKYKALSKKYFSSELTFKAIIPKGSRYYYSSVYKEYVSNSIVITEKI